MVGRYAQPEIMAPGVGLLDYDIDYDNDGDLDVYLVQGDASAKAFRSCRNRLAAPR